VPILVLLLSLTEEEKLIENANEHARHNAKMDLTRLDTFFTKSNPF
jgi:hypothetical protein